MYNKMKAWTNFDVGHLFPYTLKFYSFPWKFLKFVQHSVHESIHIRDTKAKKPTPLELNTPYV